MGGAFTLEVFYGVPNELKTTGGWNQFAIAFLVGGMGSAFFAYQIYDHLDVLKAILGGTI